MDQKTILWADDDMDDLMLMQEILQKNQKNYRIKEVKNGKQALELLETAQKENNPPCLIILDINMPVMDGKETLSNIKKNKDYASIPIVVFTTSSSELDKLFCKKHNVEMITKPPHYRNLESAVLRLLDYCSR